jgi:hypothetical protein
MHIDFTDLVLCDYDHQEALMVIVPFLGVALIMQAAFWVWAMYLTPDEIQRL